MKLCLILFALFSAALQVSGEEDKLTPEKCRKQYPTSTYTAGEKLTRNQKCLIKCALISHGILNNRGEISIEASEKVVNEFATDDEKEMELQNLQPCKAKSDGEKNICNKAYKYILCIGGERSVTRFINEK